ncbi:MAG: hypothetical protein ACI4XH_03070 [Acutalibacteraceae bacterium]
MSDSKLNSLGFDDDDVLSNLEKLKAKYAAYSEEGTETETETDTDTEPAAEEQTEEDSFFSKISDIPEEQDFVEDEQEPDEEDIGDIFFSAYSGDDEDEVTLEQNSEFDTSAFMNYEKEHNINAEESLFEEEAYPEDDDVSESFEIDEDNTETDDSYTEEISDSDDEDFYDDLDEEDEFDEFSDLDDDDDIVRIDADKNEDSPFAAALKEAANQSEQVKKAKEKQKNSSVKKSSNEKKHTKLPYIIIAVAVPILLWLTVFITDITLVSNWKTPLFCAQTYEYENGSRDYKGAFYQFQIHINEQGEVESVCLPWFVKGPNDSLK